MNEPEPVTQPEDIRRKIEEKEAVTRGTLWEQMGCPQSKLHMPIDEYMKSFRGRHWFVNKTVLAQAQLALRIILCPKCYEEKNLGIEGTQFFTTVEDDVMTVFPAVGHFVCHWCGFEEWHPLNHDPRVKLGDMSNDYKTFAAQAQGLGAHSHGQSLGISPVFGGVLNNSNHMSATEQNIRGQQARAQLEAIQQAYAAGAMSIGDAAKGTQEAIGAGMEPGMGPIWGMTEDERRSLHRLYQQSKKDKPPEIIGSKEEALELAKLPAIERRQAIIQRLRDLGKI